MNVFWRELKSYRKNLFFWSTGMVVLIWSSFVKYSTLKSTGQSMTQLIEQFPESIRAIFGLTGFDISTLSGYYGLMFIDLALLVAVHAVMLGASIISKEERDRTSEFLFVKPISRMKAITAKLLAGAFNVVVFNLVTLVSSLYFASAYGGGQNINNDIFLLMAAMLLLQMIFFILGALMAAVLKRPKSATSFAASTLLVCYLLVFIINLDSKFDNLKYLTPFKYFDAKNILADGRLDPVFVAISVVLIISMTCAVYGFYESKDLKS